MSYQQRNNLLWAVGITLALAFLFRFEPPVRNLVLLIGGGYCLVLLWPEIKRATSQPQRTVPERRPEPPKNDYAEIVFAMQVNDARMRAQPILDKLYQTETPQGADATRVLNLGPSLKELFSSNGAIVGRYSDMRIDRAEFKHYEPPIGQLMRFGVEKDNPRTRLIRLGQDADGNAILTRPGEDSVYVVRKSRAVADSYWLADYPSIYHWLLMEHPEDTR